jgi:Tfp pilus assembly protein PilF
MSSPAAPNADPGPTPADFNTLGRQLEAAGKADSAMEAYRGALLLDPLFRPAAANLARLYVANDCPRDAVRLLEPISAALPFDVALAVNYANALLEVGRVAEAEQRLTAVVHAGTTPAQIPAQAYNSLGIARYIRRDFKAACDAFRAAIAAESSFAEAHENLAQCLLHLGDYEQAWIENEWRWKNPSNHLTKRIFEEPLWDGKPLDGRTLLLHGEQGFGDTIQFARYASLIDKGPNIGKKRGKILLACQETLAPLLSTVPDVDSVYVLGDPLPAFDCHAPIVTVRRLLGTRIGNVPDRVPYIRAEPDAQIAREPGFRIGIVWSGRARHLDDPHRNRSCPPDHFAKLATIPGVQLFSLQLGRPSHEVARTGAIDLSHRITNFTDTARLISAMDAVATIDTALAHLAGALAKPCWVLPPYTADWRWTPLPDGSQPWYPQMRVIRQANPGDWAGTFARLIPQLSQHVVGCALSH